MTTKFSNALSLMRNGSYEKAKVALRSIQQDEKTPICLQRCLSFNINYCTARIKGKNSLELSQNGSSVKPIRVGTIAPNDRTKGLFRDAETVLWALSGSSDISVSVMQIDGNVYSYDYSKHVKSNVQVLRINVNGEQQLTQLTIKAWLEALDVLVLFEALNQNLLNTIKKLGNIKQVLYVPNLEWAVLDPTTEDTRPWENLLGKEQPLLISIARSRSIYVKLRSLNLPAILLEWSIPDEVVTKRQGHKIGEEVIILMNAGNFGFRGRRGFDIFINAIKQLPTPPLPIRVIIKSNRLFEEKCELIDRENIRFEINTEFIEDRSELNKYYDCANIVVYPSRFEGFGLSLIEALHRGCYVLATNGEPMSDFLPDKGMAIQAERRGLLRLSTVYEPNVDGLVARLTSILENPQCLLVNHAQKFKIRQENFVERFRSIVFLFAE
jgi:glycosyltransferase involved in cell wall biosynthesis